MTVRAARTTAIGIGALMLVVLAASAVLDARLVHAGHGALIDTVYSTGSLLFILAMVAMLGVGTAILWQQPRHPVGRLFLTIVCLVVLSSVLDHWYAFSTVGVGSLPAGGVAARISDKLFAPVLVCLSYVLLLTPDGRFLSPRWRWAGRLGVLATLGAYPLWLISSNPLTSYHGVANPWAVPALSGLVRPVAFPLSLLVGVSFIASCAGLVVRFRRSAGDERRSMLWLALALVPLPIPIVVMFAAAYLNIGWLTTVPFAVVILLIPVAAGLSVLRYRLYDVDRILTTALSWTLLTACLVTLYVGVVWAGAHMSARSPSPEATSTLGAVAAAVVALPLQRGLQDRLDRRFNRRAYQAASVVRSALAEETVGVDVEELLRRATGDPELVVGYPDGEIWVNGVGEPVATTPGDFEVRRNGAVVARIGYDRAAVATPTVARAARLVATELDNTRLRAALEGRLADLEASRRRLARAQHAERRRIERDLHDGAQQSLLALAFQLRTAELTGDARAMRSALAEGAEAARAAVGELRDLANGLHPAALADGGLAGAVEDLVRRSPTPVDAEIRCGRLDPSVEFTAWLVISEAVANAHKHASAARITIRATLDSDRLRVRVVDDGTGGADPAGSGLQGLRDRVEAARGLLVVHSDADGTTVEAVLPCGS